MSFYDDASLVFLPSGGAGKDGKAYSIKPVPEYGNELVTNGGFDTDSDWTKTNATISGGVATITSTGYAYAAVVQTNVLTIGKTYKATFDINSIVGGLRVATSQVITNSGIASVTFTATNTYLDIRRDSSFATTTVEIDNVSVREVVVGDGDFTFSRGSNLTATRVDSNGLIEKGRENLLLQSNQFDTTWLTSDTSVTSGQSGYDGSSDAWLLTKTGSYGHLQQSLSAFSGVHTFSVYIKAGDSNWARVRVGSAPKNSSYFDLQNGVIGASGTTPIDSNIENIGGGWYRCSITTNISASIVYLYPAEGDGLISGTSGSIYIQDAQLEQGLVATEYIESGATTGKAGILEDSPRFDYSGGASCPSLILEPSRTNIVPISEGIPEDTIQVTLTENYGTSPEGVQNSLKVQKNGVSASDRIFPIDNYNATLVSGTSYSVSAFVKNIDVTGVTTIGCRLGSGGTLFRLGYEWSGSSLTKVTDYAAGTRTNEILEDYGNGWWRIGFSFEADNTQGGIELDIDRANAAHTTSIETYGWQLEEGSYSSSYIPNHSGGSVTRNLDDLNDLDISSMLTTSSFTWFLDLNDYIGSDINQETIFLESSPNLKIQLRVRPDGYRFYYNNIAGGSTYPIAGSTTANKFCVSYDGNDYRLYVDGTLEATTRSVGDSGWDYIKNAIAASLPLKQMLLFPSKLSDAECITLTS